MTYDINKRNNQKIRTHNGEIHHINKQELISDLENGRFLEDYEIKYLLENHTYKTIREPFHQNNPNYREFGKPENEPVWHWTITVIKVNEKYYEIEWKQVNKPNYDSIYPNTFPKQV